MYMYIYTTHKHAHQRRRPEFGGLYKTDSTTSEISPDVWMSKCLRRQGLYPTCFSDPR